MQAKTFDITKRERDGVFDIVSIDDFTLEEREQIPAARILENEHITLYALDFPSQTAVFVETPDDVDLSQAPFYFIAQFEAATRVITIPLATMFQLADKITLDDGQLVFIQSVGRAGSTLASLVFAQVPGVINMSEPDALMHLLIGRHHLNLSGEEFRKLLIATVRILCKTPVDTAFVIKGRSFVMMLADLLHDCFPQMRSVFLYRDAESWVSSMIRAFGQDFKETSDKRAYEKQVAAQFTPLVPSIAHANPDEHLTMNVMGTMMWHDNMKAYVDLHQKGIDVLAIPFESWHSHPQKTAIAMLKHCGITVTDTTDIDHVLNQDSQAGTDLGQETTRQRTGELSDEIRQTLHQYLAQQQVIKTPDETLPNTLVIAPE